MSNIDVEKSLEIESITTNEETIKIKKRKLSENGPCTALSTKNGFTKIENHEAEYFSSYADIELHRTMIEDQVRTSAYRDAIINEAEKWIKGKVVADVGCGTGILSMFCAQAGAKKVYAIEASKIAHCAKELVVANKFENVITVIEGKAEDIELPEKVDAIVSEWMGYMLLYETMLPSVLNIRDRYLKKGGKMYPEKAILFMALAETQWITKFEENAFDFWISLTHVYSLDMSLLAEHAVQKYKNTVHVHMVAQEDVVSLPSTICDLDLYKITAKDLQKISYKFSLSSMGSRCLNSIVLWFDVLFPGGHKLSTSPDTEDTHWQNTVLSLKEARVKQDDVVSGVINISQDNLYYRHLNVDLEYNINNGETISHTYKMDDNCIDDE